MRKAWGNRTAQTPTKGSCGMWSSAYTANNQIVGYSYDAAGNLLNDGVHTYTYDAENRIIKVDGGSTATYVYDSEGRRAEKSTSNGWLDYIHDLSGRVVAEVYATGWGPGYVYLGGQLVAEYSNSTTYFVHADHLGSTRLMTAMNQSVYDSMDYLPFGEQIAGSTGTTHKFTGKERDWESNLDNFGARYFTSSMGRFMTPDPNNAGEIDEDPQSWNGYSYARNNPLRYTDPNGLDYHVCVDNGNKGQNCFNVEYLSQLQDIIKNSPGFSLQNGKILRNGVGQVGTYQYFVGPGTEGGGLQHDILGDTLIGLATGGILNAGKDLLGGLLGSAGRDAAETATSVAAETGARASRQIVASGTKQAVRDALESNTLSDAQKTAIRSALRRGAVGDKFSITQLSDGSLQVIKEVAGRAGGKAIYDQEIDAAGRTVSVVKSSYNAAGDLMNVKQKFP